MNHRHQQPNQRPILLPEHLRTEFEQSLTLPMRDKIKSFRRLGDEALNTFTKLKEHSLENLILYERIMTEAVKYHSFPQGYAAGLNKIRASRFKMMNLLEPRVISKKSGTISVNTATIAIHDASLDFTESVDSDEQLLAKMNEGQLFCFNTGSDGLFSLQVRVVDGPEPILSMKEYKQVGGAIVKPGIVKIVSGKLGITDLGPPQEVWATVAPGTYKVNVFAYPFSREEYGYYIVLAHTNTHECSHYQEIERLEALDY